MNNFILDSANTDASAGVVFRGATLEANFQFNFLPLGVYGGELVLKTAVLNAAAITIGAVTQSGTWTVALAAQRGAANLVSSHVTSTGTAATLVAGRATRRSVLIRNIEAVASGKDVWVGPATVTSSNGTKIAAGESLSFSWVGLLQVIDDNTNHAVLHIADEYD